MSWSIGELALDLEFRQPIWEFVEDTTSRFAATLNTSLPVGPRGFVE